MVLGVWFVMWCWADAWWLATLVLFAPRWPLALPLAVLVPIALVFRPRAVVLLLVTALLIAGPVMGFCLPWQQLMQSAPPGKTLRVLTCNMHYSHDDPGLLDRLVADTSPDVVAVQEWPASKRSVLHTTPGWHINQDWRLFLASRYPIRRVIELGENSMSAEASVKQYELDTPMGTVHLFSLHLATARQGLADTIHEHENGRAELEVNIDRRREQSQYVAGEAAQLQGPVVLVGDFNTPPQSRLFSSVWGDYTDAFAAAGWGWGYTFFGNRTMVRIDHILVGKGFYCRRCQVGPYVGSPHHPVLADLVWPDHVPPAKE